EKFVNESVPIFYVVLAGMAFIILSYLPYAAVMAAGRTDLFAKLYFAELVPYFLLLVFLTLRFGALGTAFAWSARAIVDCILMSVLAARCARVTFSQLKISEFAAAMIPMMIPLLIFIFYSEINAVVVG